MKKPIKKKIFLSEEKMKQERMKKQNEAKKNRSEGLKEWCKKHDSAEIIQDLVMDALDYIPKKERGIILKFLRLPIFAFEQNYMDYLPLEDADEMDNLDGFFELLKEIHDIYAKEDNMESFDDWSDRGCKEYEAKQSQNVTEDTEPVIIDVKDEDLPF